MNQEKNATTASSEVKESTGTNVTQTNPRNNTSLQIIIIFLLTVLIGLLAYTVFLKDSKKDQPSINQERQTEKEYQQTEEKQEATESEDSTIEKESEDIDSKTQSNPSNSDNINKDQAETKPAESKNKVPNGWKPIENEKYGYTAYRPSNYYYRFFDSSRILGIDPNEIPEASEYMGIVTLTVRTGDLETIKNENIADWLAIATSEEDQKNGHWELVKGTIPANEMNPEFEVIEAYIQKGNRVYIVHYHAEASDFSSFSDVFDDFYPAILFK